jgi:hypothetical protein
MKFEYLSKELIASGGSYNSGRQISGSTASNQNQSSTLG